MKRFIVLFMLISGVAWGVPSTLISTPNSFTPNTTIQSSQMNSNFTQVQNQYNLHTHTDITSLGAVTSGSWMGSVIATTYGGTGNDWSATAQGSVPVFSAAGTMSALTPGTSGQVLTSNGAGATPSWSGGGSAKDQITRGFEASASVGSVDCRVYSGNCFVGDTGVSIATTTVLQLATGGYWSSGSVVSYAGGAGWCAIGVGTGNNYVKLLGPARGNRSDTSGNSSGTNVYYWDGTNYWRIIGGVRINTSNQIETSYIQKGNTVLWSEPISINTTVSSGAWIADYSASSGIPPYSTIGIFGVDNTGANQDSGTYLRPGGTNWSTSGGNGVVTLQGGAAGTSQTKGQLTIPTSDTQTISHNNVGATATDIRVAGFIYDIR